MPSYPVSIRRCQHIKVNGSQCGSPALRTERYCHFHAICHRKGTEALFYLDELETAMLPTLEDANSIQLALAAVIRQLAGHEIDHRTAALTLYALQTASANLRMTSFEPEPTRVMIDPEAAARRPLGASAWSKVEGREYDDLMEDVRTGNGWKENSVDQFDKGEYCPWPNTPLRENERLLPGESLRDRDIRVEKQRRLEAEAKRSQEIPI